jgi:hypothetical protein
MPKQEYDPNSDVRILRDDEDEVTGFAGDPDEVPEWCQDSPGALVSGRHGFQFETPIWGHADTFMELEEAGILTLRPTHAIPFGEHSIWVYESDV